MKRRIFALLLIVILVMTGCGQSAVQEEKQKILLSLWGGELDQELLNEMAREFEACYADQADIQITVCEESEETCRDTVLFNPETAGDVYAFADDQFDSLVEAGALAPLDESECELMYKASGGKDSVAIRAASYDGQMYGYPLTASNGYFLYYNSAYISDQQAGSFEEMLKVARRNNKKVAMDLTSGWYLYSFFRTAGLDVYVTDNGKNFCDFNSTAKAVKGVEVAETIMNIAADKGFMNADNDTVVCGVESGEIIAAISGTWNEKVFMENYGDGYVATKLPTVRIKGKDRQMHSIVGYKLVGVNAYSENLQWSKKLAQWIVNEDNQLKRFEARGEGPANINVAKNPNIQASYAIAALAEQTKYGHLQRVSSKYWDPMYRFGNILCTGNLDNRDLQKLLDDTANEIR